jgi:tetratricopeptide (TPR) repeat protein
MAVTLYGRVQAGGIWSKPRSLEDFGLLSRIMQGFYIWAYYAWKFWVPLNLSPFYTTLVAFKPMAWPFVASALFVLSLTALLVYKRRQWPFLLSVWLCHLVLLVPMLGLTEHPHFPSDRYCFVAGISWSIVLAAGFIKLLDRPKQRVFVVTGAAALLISFGLLSFEQVGIWQDSVSLYRRLVLSNPYHTKLLDELATACRARKNYIEALECYGRISRLDPDDISPHQKSAAILFELKHFAEAREHYAEILRIDPENPEHYNDLGVILAASGDLSEAIDRFRVALRLNPEFASANRNMAKALLQQGRTAEVKVYSQRAGPASVNTLPPRSL